MKALALLLAALFPLAANAADVPFPDRPITLICPWPAGGSTDTHLRKLVWVSERATIERLGLAMKFQ